MMGGGRIARPPQSSAAGRRCDRVTPGSLGNVFMYAGYERTIANVPHRTRPASPGGSAFVRACVVPLWTWSLCGRSLVLVRKSDDGTPGRPATRSRFSCPSRRLRWITFQTAICFFMFLSFSLSIRLTRSVLLSYCFFLI